MKRGINGARVLMLKQAPGGGGGGGDVHDNGCVENKKLDRAGHHACAPCVLRYL